MIEHDKVVLAGILPDRRDLLLQAMQHIEPDHFRSTVHRNLWKMIERYYDVSAGIIPKSTLSDLMSRSETVDAATVLLYEEAYDECASMVVADHEFRYSIDALKDLKAKELTGEAIATTFEILERGYEVGKVHMSGHQDARKYAYEQFAAIDRLDNIESAPEGDMRHEAQDVLQEYADRKAGKTGIGVLSGIDSLDHATGGFQRGELALVCAFTNAGKTMFTCQTAWHAAVKQGKNVFFASSETVRGTVRRRIIARHSRLSMFGYERGLNAKDIRDGSLSPAEEEVLKAVVHDLDTNPNYGKIYIAQVPRGATLSYLEARMNRQAASWEVDLGIVDYLALLKPDRVRGSEREEFNDILRGGKVFATSFNEGKGVPLISPWQIRRESYNEAIRTGYYGLASLSDTSEAEKSSDQIISLFALPENKGQEVTLQFLKMRDGEIPDPVILTTDFRNAYFTEKTGISQGFHGGGSASLADLGIG